VKSRPVVFRALSLLAVFALAACSSGSDNRTSLDETKLAINGSECITRTAPAGELCFEYVDGEVTVRGLGLAAGSRVKVSGGQGDSAEFEVDADEQVSVGVGARLVLPPFKAEGTWADGEPAVLTVDS
jgi:hypothetical protein